MEGIEYLYELCEALPRCGPGDNNCTRRAYGSIPNLPDKPYILDIGCGSGMQTLELARVSDGKIIALDNYQGFLDILMKKAKDEKVEDRIIPKNISMLESAGLFWKTSNMVYLRYAVHTGRIISGSRS